MLGLYKINFQLEGFRNYPWNIIDFVDIQLKIILGL